MPETLIRIPLPSEFNFPECLWFLDRDLDDCMHQVFPGSVRKLILNGGEKILIEVYADTGYIYVKALSGTIRKPEEIWHFMDEWIDYRRDIRPFYELLDRDKDLKPLKERFRGLRIIGIPDFFEVLCWCVIGQQINLTFAYRIKRRFVEEFGDHFDFGGERYHIFPRPETISKLTVPDLRKFQLTTRKSEYILGIARQIVEGQLSKEKLNTFSDEAAIITELRKIRGIGEWTANYTVMKGFRGMNAVPYGDSGLNQALEAIKGIPRGNNRPEVEQLFKRFRDWKTYLVFYLWRSLRDHPS